MPVGLLGWIVIIFFFISIFLLLFGVRNYRKFGMKEIITPLEISSVLTYLLNSMVILVIVHIVLLFLPFCR